MTNELVKPKTCSRCAGRGYVTSGRVYAGAPGGCFKCGGEGQVEGDRATLAAQRAARAEADALALRWSRFREAARQYSIFASYGIDDLQMNAPDRFERALASFEAGREDLMPALAAHGRVYCGLKA